MNPSQDSGYSTANSQEPFEDDFFRGDEATRRQVLHEVELYSGLSNHIYERFEIRIWKSLTTCSTIFDILHTISSTYKMSCESLTLSEILLEEREKLDF